MDKKCDLLLTNLVCNFFPLHVGSVLERTRRCTSAERSGIALSNASHMAIASWVATTTMNADCESTKLAQASMPCSMVAVVVVGLTSA